MTKMTPEERELELSLAKVDVRYALKDEGDKLGLGSSQISLNILESMMGVRYRPSSPNKTPSNSSQELTAEERRQFLYGCGVLP